MGMFKTSNAEKDIINSRKLSNAIHFVSDIVLQSKP